MRALAESASAYHSEVPKFAQRIALGPGLRSNRYACVVEDGVVGACFVEAGPGDLTVSDGATLLKAL